MQWERFSYAHIHARIIQANNIPHARSGKIVTLAMTKVVQGEPVTNVEALEYFRRRVLTC